MNAPAPTSARPPNAAGPVDDSMAGGPKHDSQSQVSSATQHVAHAKANWRQARPPKASDIKQEASDLDLQAGAALLAGIICRVLHASTALLLCSTADVYMNMTALLLCNEWGVACRHRQGCNARIGGSCEATSSTK